MDCEYCKKDYGNKPLYEYKKERLCKTDGGSQMESFIEYNILNFDGWGDTYEPSYIECEIEINYCPMCGRKLKESGE